MAAPDLEVIKDIPGYKVILKAVLKSQIQHLVEQLASTTDEESVILTASVADGTLSHLGSESAKGFLEDHEDIKSQFLGFCLKTHHRQKQEKQRLEAEAALKQARRTVERHPSSLRGPYPARGPRFSSPPGSGPLHPVAIARASRTSVRSPGSRHEPYPTTRSSRRTSTEPSPVELQDNPGQPIKLEENVETNQGESDTVTAVEQGSSNESPSSDADAKDDDASSESATSAKLNEPLSDADLSNMTSGSHQETGGELDSSVTVKMEEFTESDMDLEITGVQPGSSVSQDNWDPNLSMGMNFDPTSVIGNQDDMGAQGYSYYPEVTVSDQEQKISNLEKESGLKIQHLYCSFCGKILPTSYHLRRHVRSHTGEKPFKCRFCDHRAARKDAVRSHEKAKHADRLQGEF